MKPITRTITILILSLIGIFLSIYLLIQHYTESPSICNIDEYWNCDRVNRGPYSELGYLPAIKEIPVLRNIPIAGIGFLGFSARLVLMFILVHGKRVTPYLPAPFSRLNELQYITIFSIGGTLYGMGYISHISRFL